MTFDEILWYVVVLLMVFTIGAFFVGRRKNRKITQAIYASAWEVLKDRCPSDLARFKASWSGNIVGTFEMKRGEVFETLELVTSMIQRELGLHYLLSKRLKRMDRFWIWAAMRKEPAFDMVAVSWDGHKLSDLILQLKLVDIGDVESNGFKVYSSDAERARRFFADKVVPNMGPLAGGLKEFVVSRDRAVVYVLSEAKADYVGPSLRLALDLGAFASRGRS